MVFYSLIENITLTSIDYVAQRVQQLCFKCVFTSHAGKTIVTKSRRQSGLRGLKFLISKQVSVQDAVRSMVGSARRWNETMEAIVPSFSSLRELNQLKSFLNSSTSTSFLSILVFFSNQQFESHRKKGLLL